MLHSPLLVMCCHSRGTWLVKQTNDCDKQTLRQTNDCDKQTLRHEDLRTKKGKTPWQAWVVRCLFCLWFALFCVCFLCLCAVACLKKLEMRSSPNTFFSCKSEKTLHCTFGFNFHYLSLLLPCLPAILACLPSLPAVVLLLCVFFGVL